MKRVWKLIVVCVLTMGIMIVPRTVKANEIEPKGSYSQLLGTRTVSASYYDGLYNVYAEYDVKFYGTVNDTTGKLISGYYTATRVKQTGTGPGQSTVCKASYSIINGGNQIKFNWRITETFLDKETTTIGSGAYTFNTPGPRSIE